MFRLLCGISLSEYLKIAFMKPGRYVLLQRKGILCIYRSFCYRRNENKLQHLEDIANEASDEIRDDDKENGTSGILKLCDQLADKIHAYLASANSSELQNTDISSSKNTKSTISIEMPVTIKKFNNIVVHGLFSEEQIKTIISLS